MKINWKYTIGEILIVIVGISVAFMLNNWAAKSKENTLRRQYLQNLENDLKGEIEHLEENIIKLDAQIGMANQLLPVLGRDIPGRDTLVKNVFALAKLVNFLPNNTTYKTLTNSGHMSLIGDLELRHQIELHYNSHKLVLQDYERQLKIHELYLGDFFIHELDYSKVFKGDVNFMDKPVFRNIIQSLKGSIILARGASVRGIESNKVLLELVENQLEK